MLVFKIQGGRGLFPTSDDHGHEAEMRRVKGYLDNCRWTTAPGELPPQGCSGVGTCSHTSCFHL